MEEPNRPSTKLALNPEQWFRSLVCIWNVWLLNALELVEDEDAERLEEPVHSADRLPKSHLSRLWPLWVLTISEDERWQ